MMVEDERAKNKIESSRKIPDEEGTEIRKPGHRALMRQAAAERSPMRRGLKYMLEQAQADSADIHAAERSPMRRGLK